MNRQSGMEAPYPAAIEDVKAAIRFLRANADTYGYDADRFAIWGESAGAYLATMAAVTSDEEYNTLPFIGEDELDREISAEVSALVEFYGMVEFDREDANWREEGIPKLVVNMANLYLDSLTDGYDSWADYWIRKNIKDCTEEEMQEYNPLYYIRENFNSDSDFKALIQHGDADLTVCRLQSEHLYETFCEVIGKDAATVQYFEGYKHGDDRFYSEENLEYIKGFLDENL